MAIAIGGLIWAVTSDHAVIQVLNLIVCEAREVAHFTIVTCRRGDLGAADAVLGGFGEQVVKSWPGGDDDFWFG